MQEYKHNGWPIDCMANKSSVVKHKSPDPSYHLQQWDAPKKRRGGHQEKAKQERCARKQAEHSHFASLVNIEEIPQNPHFNLTSRFGFKIAPQPQWPTAPSTIFIASFGKNKVEVHKQPIASSSKLTTLSSSVWLSLNKAREICNSLSLPKTAKNLKPLKAPKVIAPIKPTTNPFNSYEKASKAVKGMMKDKPISSPLKGKGKLVEWIMTLPLIVELFNHSPNLNHFNNDEESGFDWQSPPEVCCNYLQEPPVSLGDEDEHPTFYYEGIDGDYLDNDIYPKKMDIDNEIVDIAGLPAIGTERYVSSLATNYY